MEPLKQINFVNDVLGITNSPCFMRFLKRVRNPDVFTYDHSIDYKEDFELIPESMCNCGCQTAVYVKEEWTGDGYDTEFKTQIEYEKLPNQPKPTKDHIKLQTEIILADHAETEAGIIHGQESCSMIPIPKLICRKPEMQD